MKYVIMLILFLSVIVTTAIGYPYTGFILFLVLSLYTIIITLIALIKANKE